MIDESNDSPERLGDFEIIREIGRGGMGVVYLATQAFPERKVALKVLSHDLAADPGFRERFVRESNAAASTEHPHIVPIYGAGESDGELYLAMRYVEGTDLRSLLEREGALAPERAARICAARSGMLRTRSLGQQRIFHPRQHIIRRQSTDQDQGDR